MNIIKGIGRMALALAVVTLVWIFILSVTALIDEKKPNPEYAKWEKEYSGRKGYLYERNPSIKHKPIKRTVLWSNRSDPVFKTRQKGAREIGSSTSSNGRRYNPEKH